MIIAKVLATMIIAEVLATSDGNATQPGRGLAVTGLTCEYRVCPLGIDVPNPMLGWILQSPVRGDRQTAYQVLVASTPGALAANTPDLWDSGRVTSDRSVGILYEGRPLHSGMRVWWKVRAWDRDGRPAPDSEPQWWEMALLSPQDWHGKWICHDQPLPQRDEDFYKDSPAPLLRKDFVASRPIRKARLNVSGLGYYELHLNGAKVGDQVLDPGWTSYAKRVLYSTYDVTTLIQQGGNALGVILGNGWYNPLPLRMWGHLNLREHLTVGRPRVILQLNIEYADGTTGEIVTDETWKTADGPILRNSVYLGEVYDARREIPGWDRPGFNDRGWQAAVAATDALGPLRAQAAPPIKVGRIIKPVAMTEPAPGLFIFDLGENFAGWVRLRARGKAGDTITLTFGELLMPDGTLNPKTVACGQIKTGRAKGGPGAPDDAFHRYTVILKGDGEEVYTPRFTFHGFRYVEVAGYPGRPALEALEGLALYSDVGSAGSFSCSNPMLDRIQEAFRRSLLSNLFSVESDCPHREKFGYGGDIVACSEAAIYNFDMSGFYAKAVEDLQDAVRPNGGFTETAPFTGVADKGMGEGVGPVLWGTAHPVLQKRLLQHYGNRRLLAEQAEATGRWMAFLETKAKDHILTQCLGDHETLAPRSTAVSSTAYYYWTACLCRDFAEILGKTGEVRRYDALAGRIRDAFNRTFLDAKTGKIDNASQANQAFALALGLLPDQDRAAALAVLVDDVMTTHKGHLSTGIFGTDCLLQALGQAGRADVAYTIVTRKTFPGWGYMLENGATTLWEHWALDTGTFSHNHPMFGSVSAWFFKFLGGIQCEPGAIGFDRIIIAPQIVGDLTWVKASHESVRGTIRSGWVLDGKRLTLDITIPVNTTATIRVPATATAKIREGGYPAEESPGVRRLGRDKAAAVFEVGAGTYQFSVE
jgi:alpha-L-rhamnosidase